MQLIQPPPAHHITTESFQEVLLLKMSHKPLQATKASTSH